ncbi:hypothetical protein HAALTHF_39290n [Vreelandella aquamarina]|nr:hypothetical protein HAALTHF_39290n [Halomonas axialensis]
MVARFIAAGDDIAADFEAREFSRAIRKIMELADEANAYIAEKSPGHSPSRVVAIKKYWKSARWVSTYSASSWCIWHRWCPPWQSKPVSL